MRAVVFIAVENAVQVVHQKAVKRFDHRILSSENGLEIVRISVTFTLRFGNGGNSGWGFATETRRRRGGMI
jgi:hypothetical protein